MAEERVEDLDVPPHEADSVQGGEGPALEGDPDQPIVVGSIAKKLPGKRTPPTVTLKRG